MIKRLKDRICKKIVNYLNNKGYYGDMPYNVKVPIREVHQKPIRIQCRNEINPSMLDMYNEDKNFVMNKIKYEIINGISHNEDFISAIKFTQETNHYGNNIIITGSIEVLKEDNN